MPVLEPHKIGTESTAQLIRTILWAALEGLTACVGRTSEGHFVELEECLEGAALAKPSLHRHEDNSSGNLRLLGECVEVHIPEGAQPRIRYTHQQHIATGVHTLALY